MPASAAPGGEHPPCTAGLGILNGEIGPGLVDRVIELAGCRERRRRLLPAQAVVYFVLGLCLFSGADSSAPPGYRSVMRRLTNGLRHMHGLALPTSSALSRAWQRLGSKPLELMFDLRRGPLACAGTAPRGVRVRAAAGGLGRDEIDAVDTPENAASSASPRAAAARRYACCDTHAIIDAAFDRAGKASEHKLARRLLHALGPRMLLLADRNFRACLNLDTGKKAITGRLDLHHRLVGFDFEEGLAFRDRFSFFFEPRNDLASFLGHFKRGHDDTDCHSLDSSA